MKKGILTFICLLLATGPVLAKKGFQPGSKVPEFSLKDGTGKAYKLSDFKGKIVVLEWTNPGCPYVRKHYDSGNMQKHQADFTKKGVAWLSIVSSAPGKQGYLEPAEALEQVKQDKSKATALLLDPDGKVGHLYKATNTPQMFVVDKEGKLAYAGAIDDKPSFRKEEVKGAHSYVREVLDALLAGKPVTTEFTKAYGCSVKY